MDKIERHPILTIPDNGEKPRQVLELHDVFCDRFLEEKKENK